MLVDPRDDVYFLQHELDEVYQDLQLGLGAQVLGSHVGRLEELELFFKPAHDDDADADAELVGELQARGLDQLEVVVEDVDAALQDEQRVAVFEAGLVNRSYSRDVEGVVQVEVLFDLLDVVVLVAHGRVQTARPADQMADDREVEVQLVAQL